jgi:hypothetical protein
MRHILIIILLMFGCQTIPSYTRTDSEDKKQTTEKDCLRKVTHKIKYENQGTRSEREDGYLYVDNYIIPDLFTFIQFQNDAYSFAINTKRFGKTGYHLSEVKNFEVDSTDLTINEKENGWYLGRKLKPGVSSCWTYVEWNGGAAFINTEKIEKIISNPPFNAIYPLSRLNIRLLN